MATITGLTAERMQEIIDKTITSANIVGGHLILTLNDGSTVDAGPAAGPQGPPGIQKVTAFPTVPTPTDGDMVIRIDMAGDPVFKYSTESGGWVLLAGGLAKVTAFPASPADGDGVVRTDLNGSPIFMYSTENGWEQLPRMGAVTVPAVRLRKSVDHAAQAAGVSALLSFDTEDVDTDTMHDTVTNTTRITIKTPGLYRITCALETLTPKNDGNYMVASLLKNGVVVNEDYRTAGPGTYSAKVEDVQRLVAGDYLEFRVGNGGGAASFTPAGAKTFFEAVWLGGPGQTVDERGVPAARIDGAGTQSIPTATWTTAVMATEKFDTNDMADLVASTTRITIKTPGLYLIRGYFDFAGTSEFTMRGARIIRNGSATPLVTEQRDNTGGGDASRGITEVLEQLAAGDYLELQVFQRSPGSLTLAGSQLSAILVGSGKTVTPYAFAYASANIASFFPTGSWTAVALNSEKADNDSIHDTTTNTSRLFCKTAGVYLVQGRVVFGVAGGGTRGVSISRNGADTIAIDYGNAPTNNYVDVAGVIELAVGDYVEMQGFQDSGAAQPMVGDTTGSSSALKMVKIGAPNAGQTGVDIVEAWHNIGNAGEPAFTNAWVNNGGVDAPAGFYKDRNRVYLRGLINGGAAGSTAFTLPVGYRPTYPVRVPVINNGAFTYLYVGTDGTVKPQAASTGLSIEAASFAL